MYQTWREHCSPIITEVIQRVGTEDMKALRKALRDAYPYGEKRYFPYKTWCSEIRRQLKLDIPVLDMPLFDKQEQ